MNYKERGIRRSSMASQAVELGLHLRNAGLSPGFILETGWSTISRTGKR